MYSQNGQLACKAPRPLCFTVVIDRIGQVSVGVLPVGHASSVHAIEYSESPE
jgi:hypothetical protein